MTAANAGRDGIGARLRAPSLAGLSDVARATQGGDRVTDRVLRAAAALLMLGVLLVPVQRVMAGERGDSFTALRVALDRQLGVHGKGVPMMWAVSMIARGYTHGGVRGLRVVEYESLPGGAAGVDRAALERTVRERLGTAWSPMVRERSEHETSLVYVQPAGADGKRMRMLVVDLDGSEVNLVRMELSPEALADWEKNGEHH